MAGGTWLFSEPQPPAVTALVDLTTMGWTPWERTPAGLTLAATCTVATLATIPAADGWTAHPLLQRCADALLASFKVQTVATVGGNVARGFAAGAIVTLCAALDADALVWCPDGTDRRVRVADLVVGNGVTTLAPGEVLRAVEIPERALRARTASRRIALSAVGRSGALVVGRVDEDGAWTVVVHAATTRPVVLRYDDTPAVDRLAHDVREIDAWFTDPHGSADWRRAVTGLLAREVRDELAAGAPDVA